MHFALKYYENVVLVGVVLAARRYASAVLAVIMCMSVSPSVTLVTVELYSVWHSA